MNGPILAFVASQIPFLRPHLLSFSSLLSRSTSSTLAFQHIRFPSLPLRSKRNPFLSPPYPVVLLPPLPHQPFTISTSPSSPPKYGQNSFSSPPSPVILLPPLPHHLSRTSLPPSLPRCRRLPDLDGTHSRAPYLLSFSSLLLVPPLPHQPSTIFASHRCLPDLDGTHSRAPHLLPFSSLLSRTNLSPSPLAIMDAIGTGDWEQEISTEPIALFSSLLSHTILSRFPVAVVDAAGMGDWEREISTEPIVLFSSFLSRTNLSPSWPCHRGCRWDEDRERKIRMVGRRAW